MPDEERRRKESMEGAGPKRITIEDYKRRSHLKKKPVEPKIPVVKLPKRRGGILVNLRRSLAALRRYLDTAPEYNQTHALWIQVADLEQLIKDEVEKKKKKKEVKAASKERM